MRTRNDNNFNTGRDTRRNTPGPFGVTDPFTGLAKWATPIRPTAVPDGQVRRIDPSEGVTEALKERRPGRAGLPGTGDPLRDIGQGFNMNQSNVNPLTYNLNIASVRSLPY